MEPKLFISGDRQVATLVIPANEAVGLGVLRAMLAASDIHSGLEPGALLAATRFADHERTLVVARGRPVQHGADGRIDLLIGEPASVYAEGTVDLHELHHFREVAAGTPLARIIAPTEGTPGFDVHGHPLPAKPGKTVAFGSLLGPGCVADTEDPSLARAEISGIYQRFTRGGRAFLQVTPEVEVPGDIDLTIGNISSHYHVVVKGDVHATFSLKSDQGALIRGSIEDARVSIRGDLEVQGGILQGNQRVKAHGDIRARHIQAREVKARNVTADLAIHFATIRATGRVTAKEIIGGEVLAAGSITCDTLGDPEGRPTLIQVGVNPFEEALVTWAHQRGDHLERELLLAKERTRLLAHRVQTCLSAGEDHAGDDLALRQALAEYADLQRIAARCREIIEQHPARLEKAAALLSHAYVEVRRRINPGVTIRIGEDAELVIREPQAGGIFRRVGDRVWVGA